MSVQIQCNCCISKYDHQHVNEAVTFKLYIGWNYDSSTNPFAKKNNLIFFSHILLFSIMYSLRRDRKCIVWIHCFPRYCVPFLPALYYLSQLLIVVNGQQQFVNNVWFTENIHTIPGVVIGGGGEGLNYWYFLMESIELTWKFQGELKGSNQTIFGELCIFFGSTQLKSKFQFLCTRTLLIL